MTDRELNWARANPPVSGARGLKEAPLRLAELAMMEALSMMGPGMGARFMEKPSYKRFVAALPSPVRVEGQAPEQLTGEQIESLLNLVQTHWPSLLLGGGVESELLIYWRGLEATLMRLRALAAEREPHNR